MNIYVQCKGCNSTLEVQDRKTRTREWCSKKCYNQYHKTENAHNNYFRRLKRKFNILEEQYYKMAKDGCNICGKKDDISIHNTKIKMPLDHCHTTGKPRGVLCTDCNTGLGKFKDNIDTLNNAIRYLNNHK